MVDDDEMDALLPAFCAADVVARLALSISSGFRLRCCVATLFEADIDVVGVEAGAVAAELMVADDDFLFEESAVNENCDLIYSI
jgi:hypothetical protein